MRQLRAVPPPAALTILRALAPLGDDPRRPDANVNKLTGYEDRYRLRVGDYRVIYEIMDEQLVILAQDPAQLLSHGNRLAAGRCR